MAGPTWFWSARVGCNSLKLVAVSYGWLWLARACSLRLGVVGSGWLQEWVAVGCGWLERVRTVRIGCLWAWLVRAGFGRQELAAFVS